MKKILSYISVAALGIFTFASCNINSNPVFSDKDAFVGFDKAALSVDEDGKTVTVQVNLASLEGLSSTVSFDVVDGTAKKGVNYSISGATTLSFSKENRTQNITINIIDIPGVYTGDLKFDVVLKDAGDVKMSADNKCTVTIVDLDHPLAAILGKYTSTGTKSGKNIEWSNELRKDPNDPTLVWIYDIAGLALSSWDGWDISYYGVVDADKKKITIALGQESEYVYSNGNPVTLLTVDSAMEYIYDSGNIYAEISYNNEETQDAVKSIKFDVDQTSAGEGAGIMCYIEDAGNVGYAFPPIEYVKK